MGAPLSTLLCNALIVGLNLYLLYRKTQALEHMGKILFQPLLISLISVGAPALAVAYLTHLGGNEWLLFLAAIPVTLFLMLIFSQMLGVIDVRLILRSGTTGKIPTHLGKSSFRLKKS